MHNEQQDHSSTLLRIVLTLDAVLLTVLTVAGFSLSRRAMKSKRK